MKIDIRGQAGMKSPRCVPSSIQEGKVIHHPSTRNRVAGVPQEQTQLSPPQPVEMLRKPHISADEEERTIVIAVLHGDSVEFEILVRRYQSPIYHLMLRATKHEMTAEDLTQDAFTRAYEKLHTYKLRKRFFPWLYTIAVNVCRDHMRRRGISQNVFTDKADNQPWPDPRGDDCARKPDCVLEVGQISRIMEDLPLLYSEPMLLYYREGFSIREIAGALGISSAAVKVRIHRGRRTLKNKLGVDNERE